MTAWPEQTWYVWGLFLLAAAGAMLPIRTERRDDFPMMAIAVMVAAAVTGAGPRASRVRIARRVGSARA